MMNIFLFVLFFISYPQMVFNELNDISNANTMHNSILKPHVRQYVSYMEIFLRLFVTLGPFINMV